MNCPFCGKSIQPQNLVVIFYGIIDEVHQLFIPGRMAEILDWLADVGGALIGILLVLVLVKMLDYKSNKFDQVAEN